MRHNVKVTIISDERYRPLRFYISGGGRPDDMRVALRRAMRSKRRLVKLDAERVAVNIMLELGYHIESFHIYPREGKYAWKYTLDLVSTIPTITITYPAGDKNQFNLFKFVGPELRNLTKPLAPRSGVKQGRRGRPSHLQTDPRIREIVARTRVPLRVDPVLGPVYAEDEK